VKLFAQYLKEVKMIKVSELAATALVQSVHASGEATDKGFRLRKQEDRFMLEIDSPAENDRVVKHQDAIALIVDQGVEEEAGDVLIDVEERPDGPQLIMRSTPPQE
jgi:hypothetical protein